MKPASFEYVIAESWDAAAEVVVMFALGECSAEFLRADLGARVCALREPNGKIRPVGCGSVLRRLAGRGSRAGSREDVQGDCGKREVARGRAGGWAVF